VSFVAIVALALGPLVVPLGADAQTPMKKVYRIGFVFTSVPDPNSASTFADWGSEAFLQGLRELG
jgi:hypothetical protein